MDYLQRQRQNVKSARVWATYEDSLQRWLSNPTAANQRALEDFLYRQRQLGGKFMEAYMAERESWARR